MKKFPNKMIATAYDKAKGKVFTKRSDSGHYVDETGDMNYDHISMQWLEHKGIITRELDNGPYGFKYKVVK